MSQALSAMLARSVTSALLSYVVVASLTLGTVLAFGLALPLSGGGSYGDREDRVWWLLAPNPFVVLADSAPRAPMKRNPGTGYLEAPPVDDPLGGLGRGVRQMRWTPEEKRAYYERYDGNGDWPRRSGVAVRARVQSAARCRVGGHHRPPPADPGARTHQGHPHRLITRRGSAGASEQLRC